MLLLEKITHFEHEIRPLLAKILPHKLFIAIYAISRNSYLKLLSKSANKLARVHNTLHPQTLLSNQLNFPNDLANAAGFDKDGSLLEFNYQMGAGFAVVGTVLSRRHTGNLQSFFGCTANPWVPLCKSKSAFNSLGLPNKGVDQVIANIRSFRSKYPQANFPIAISVMGHPSDSAEEKLAGVLSVIEKIYQDIDFIEINESCPNCKHQDDWEDFQLRVKKIIGLRDSWNVYVPIFIKFNYINNPKELLKFLNDLGVDGLVVSNTRIDYQELAVGLDQSDESLYQYYSTKYQGGVSGQLIKQPVWELVQELDQMITDNSYSLKLIHVGGIDSREDLEQSRSLKNVILREWYTGLLEQMGTKPWSKIYPNMV